MKNTDSIGRRSFVRGSVLAILAAANTCTPALAKPSVTADPSLDALVAELVAAFTHEADTYRKYSGIDTPEANECCDASTGRACDAEIALVAAGAGADDFQIYGQALALVARRWLIMESAYTEPTPGTDERLYCRLIDIILRGSPLDDVPLLWQIDDAYVTRDSFFARLRA